MPQSIVSRAASILSLVLFSGLVWGYLWWGKFSYHHSSLLLGSFAGALLLILANHILHRDRPAQLGLRLDNLASGALWFGLPALLLAALVSILGTYRGTFRLDGWDDIYTYIPWAILQQWILQNFLRLRSEEALSESLPKRKQGRFPWKAVVLTSALFALYHLPNVPLMLFSLAGALLWCSAYARVPSLPWAALSQALLTIVLLLFFKYDLLQQFEVGEPGFRYDFYGTGVKVAAGYDSSGQPFIATLPGPDRSVPARVKIFKTDGTLLMEWVAFEGLDFSGEISVGDLGFAAGDEIAVAAGPGSSNLPLVRIFDSLGKFLGEIEVSSFPQQYGAWVSIACGRLYVCPGPGPQSPQELVEMDSSGRVLDRWDFSGTGFVNGLRGTGLCAAGQQGADSLLVWGTDISVNPSTLFLRDRVSETTRAIPTLDLTFGAQVAVLRRGSEPTVAVGPGPLAGYPPLIRVLALAGTTLHQFAGYDDAKACGSNLATLDVDGDGVEEIILGEGIGPGRPAVVRIYDTAGSLRTSWQAYDVGR